MSNPLVMDDTCAPQVACETRYRERLRARRWYRTALDRLVRAKRVYQGAVIGYVVFDPTVAGVLPPFFLSLVPIIALQIWWSRRWNQARRGVEFYRRSLQRRHGDWSDRGDAGDRYRDSDHLYSGDLDLFGTGSLYQWLCAPHMSWGCDVLADWLAQPADAVTIRERQDAVRELSEQLDLREAIDAFPHATAAMEREAMYTTATARPIVSRDWLRWPLAAAAWVWIMCLIQMWFRGGWWWQPALVGLVAEVFAYACWRADVHAISNHGFELGCSLRTEDVFSRIVTRHTWKCELLRRMADDSSAGVRWPHRPSALGLGWVLQLPLAYFLAIQLWPWFEGWLHRRLSRFPRALAGIGHWETLGAFGAAAYENPGSSFPIICTDQTCLIAEGLTHPLLKADHAVANDIRLDSSQRLLLVSGSNMSGKSTLLRAVGVNAVLALAGAPVRATSLTLSPLNIATAMRFQDSLGAGTSFFYAVLQRMHSVLEQLQQPQPLLFLLDEILPGTNSHDRLIGAEAVIRRLLASNALGLVTTHDLELTCIAERMVPAAVNMHFADEVVAGKLCFDYRLQPGVVRSSNALKLMRDMGLDV